jgi:fibro-slime domain-containing protein
MSQRKFLVLFLLGVVGCKERMRVVVGPLDGGAGNGGQSISDDGGGQSPDFGFFIPDVPPPVDVLPRDVVPIDVPDPVCGNSKLEGSEGCDDGNLTASDGCSSTCTTEAEYVCPVPGQPCVRTVMCGDHKQTGGEACDDGNNAAGDGCSPACQIEPGWTCPRAAACRPRCGDGTILPPEQCDDGNTNSGDGCSAICVIETGESFGWVCPQAGQPCQRTTCGDGVRQGSEPCDDGNNESGDGCSPFCRRERSCPPAGGPCTTVCGDGLLLPIDKTNGQECDDGNTTSGDGCSADCKIERGYACAPSQVVENPLRLPILYRDFKAKGEPNGHPDFESVIFTESGIVQDALSATGKPVHVAADKQTTTNNDAGWNGFDYFGVWYKDDPNYNRTIPDFLSFNLLAGGGYQFSSNDFFPIDNRGWGNFTGGADRGGRQRNFHFTSELRYWFEYRGGERLDFTGDDDVWVFINKHLVVDLGGVHEAKDGSVILDANNGTAQVCDLLSSCSGRRAIDLALVRGNVYEIVVFQAERHTFDSNYKLTLANFGGQKSACKTVCGDGILSRDEACDLGSAGNTGAYGTCNADCTLPPGCGDGVVNGQEQCDDGVNAATYAGTNKICGAGCVWAGFCGDGTKNGPEPCDQGAANDAAAYGAGKCTTACTAAPYCGDGVVQPGYGEECDGGPNCNTACKRDNIR